MKLKNILEYNEIDNTNKKLQKIRDKIKFHEEQIKLLKSKLLAIKMK